MSLKSVAKVVVSQEQGEGDGATVRRSIGTNQLRNLDPFLMLDEFKVKEPAGFPDHPHRGFETVTYMLKGKFQHEDFCGHRGEIGPSDLQWMTAGRGIVHAELPLGNETATGLQLWVNLPAKAKMIEPRYQELLKDQVPLAKSPSGGVSVKVIAGNSYGVDSKVHTYSPILYLDVQMEKNETFVQEVKAGWTAFAYTLSGTAFFGSEEKKAPEHTTLVLSSSGDQLRVETRDSTAHFVVIAGEPIGEPIVQHGPFVMNTREEIQTAFMDFSNGLNGFERAVGWQSEISKNQRRYNR